MAKQPKGYTGNIHLTFKALIVVPAILFAYKAFVLLQLPVVAL